MTPQQHRSATTHISADRAQRSVIRPTKRGRAALVISGIVSLVLAVGGLFAFGLASLGGPLPGGLGGAAQPGSGEGTVAAELSGEPGREDGSLGQEGVLSPFEDDHPAVANLDPELRSAMQRAATDAQAQGVDFWLTSGWRSERFQQLLFDEAVTNYLSEEEASRWVSRPTDSNHVTGNAVDIGPTDANSWLSQHGAAYGLCQTYSNEMWHFELDEISPEGWCPEPLTDASAG
ncbi:M15 family metallopeptidase [Leucobacter sp. M11]|uniref:M15 family metallopeptidase n=1 Tax=Leucobacter sp. M11 TaxID=2993565 RepID=UPI002D811566|nr:M15 family metallopeptidase [Leucobacter sp. M11]MEB4613444.1 M15 family metallopeptidase [Leucobacter sp. M11]